jgi:N-methylhydantoinase B/oxoprolinase/acetone carboxylase alpha subunit
MVRYLANAVLMQALAASEKWNKEVVAISAGHRNLRHAGVNQYGKYVVSALGHSALDGTGARSYADGVIVHLEGTNVLEKIQTKQPIDDIAKLGGQAANLAYKEFEFKNGDVVYMKMASGGGYGDPLQRDPQLVLEDVIEGLVSEEAAREVYGVALDAKKDAVDLTETKSLRAKLQKQRPVRPEQALIVSTNKARAE